MRLCGIVVRPVLLACLVAIGFGVVFGAVVGWSLLIGEQLFGAKRGNEYVVVREDGTPLISSSPSVYGSNILRTLEGV